MALDQSYRTFVANHPRASVWHDADLLEALASPARREHMDYAGVYEAGRLVAVWPFCRKARIDGWVITLPPLMRYCGPLCAEDWLEQRGLPAALGELWVALLYGADGGRAARFRSLDQAWPFDPAQLPKPAEWPLFAAPRPTHIADLRGGPNQLTAAQSKQMRYDLRRAGRTLRSAVVHQLSAAAEALLGAPYRRQGVAQPFGVESLRALFAALGPAERIACIEVRNDGRELQACAIVLADARTGYALLTAVAEEARALSGGSYAMYGGMRWAMERGCAHFDFLGSATPGIADNFRRLGGVAQAYSLVHVDVTWWTRAWREWKRARKETSSYSAAESIEK